MRKEPNAAAIVPICHPVDSVSRLLFFSLPQLVGSKNLFPPETNDHVLLKHLTAAGVLITIASTIPLRHPHNLQYHAHGADSGHLGSFFAVGREVPIEPTAGTPFACFASFDAVAGGAASSGGRFVSLWIVAPHISHSTNPHGLLAQVHALHRQNSGGFKSMAAG